MERSETCAREIARLLQVEILGCPVGELDLGDGFDGGAAPNLEFALRRHAVRDVDGITDLMCEEADYEAALGIGDPDDDDGFAGEVLLALAEACLGAGAAGGPPPPGEVRGVAAPDRMSPEEDRRFAGALLENLGLAQGWRIAGEARIDVELSPLGERILGEAVRVS